MREHTTPRTIWTNPLHFIACGFGAGNVRLAPATFGTLIAIPFYLLFRHCHLWCYIGLVALAFCVGIWLCDKTAKDFGVVNHPGIVWDEMVGFWITMSLAPLKLNWLWIIIGFGLFRLFDIWKPWPIIWVNRHTKGGFGMMVDDLVAGIYAWVVLQVIIFGTLK